MDVRKPLRSDLFPVLKYPNPTLARITLPITCFDGTLKETASKMLVTMYTHGGIGLAANQVGIDSRIIVIDTGFPKEFLATVDMPDAPVRGQSPLVLINPSIINYTPNLVKNKEGCLSFPDKLRVSVVRHSEIEVQYKSLDGKEIQKRFRGIEAICIQHEIDHLNGITLADKMSQYKRTRFNKQLREP